MVLRLDGNSEMGAHFGCHLCYDLFKAFYQIENSHNLFFCRKNLYLEIVLIDSSDWTMSIFFFKLPKKKDERWMNGKTNLSKYCTSIKS